MFFGPNLTFKKTKKNRYKLKKPYMFFRPKLTFGLFRAWFGIQIIFGFGVKF